MKKNKGSPGVDGVTIAEFESRLTEELSRLKEELESWTYKPSPVRRVEIPKPGGKGIRLLGVPTVRDRVVHATLKELLEPIFEPLFSDHSYGFRPERNQRQAVEAAREIVAGGKPYVVDIDLSKFFDRIHHDRLIARLSQQVADKRILRLIGLLLRSGIMANGLVTPSTEGAVQGSPLSPLLSNIVLDELDKELERRGLEFCRFADDCNIFVKTPKAAERVMESVSGYIEKRLKLVVNQDKSQVARSDRVKFLGMTIVGKTIAISHKALQTAMAKVKELTPRGTHLTLENDHRGDQQLVRGLVELLCDDLLPRATEEDRSPYSATISIPTGGSTKEQAQSLSKAGQAWRAAPPGGKGGVLQQQALGAVEHLRGEQGVSGRLVHRRDGTGHSFRQAVTALV